MGEEDTERLLKYRVVSEITPARQVCSFTADKRCAGVGEGCSRAEPLTGGRMALRTTREVLTSTRTARWKAGGELEAI